MSTVTIPQPGPWLTANQHTHWRNRNARTGSWRAAAASAALDPTLCVVSPFKVSAIVWRADRRRYDLDGIAPTVKACIDGLRDAGVIEDDDTRHMTALTITHGGVDKTAPRIVLTIEED